MKKCLCALFCIILAAAPISCGKKPETMRVWLVSPQNAMAEEEIKQLVVGFDSRASVSFVPMEDMNSRLSEAIERDYAPDLIMLDCDAIPDLAEDKKLDDLDMRLSASKVKADELSDGARRACIYQGKTYGIPVFCDVYMLATDNSLVATPPDSISQLKEVRIAEAKSEKSGSGKQGESEDKVPKESGEKKESDTGESDGSEKNGGSEESKVKKFDKLPPKRQSLLFESALYERGGKMLNSRRTRLAFASEEGRAALEDCTELLDGAAEMSDSIGDGNTAFSVLTTLERRKLAEKYPDADITLSPLPGVNRLQTFALVIGDDTKEGVRAFRTAEFLYENTDRLSKLYKLYPASKDIKPLNGDEDAVTSLVSARPAPDLCGYDTLITSYLPSAIERAGKGTDPSELLSEVVEDASANIWKGKRE